MFQILRKFDDVRFIHDGSVNSRRESFFEEKFMEPTIIQKKEEIKKVINEIMNLRRAGKKNKNFMKIINHIEYEDKTKVNFSNDDYSRIKENIEELRTCITCGSKFTIEKNIKNYTCYTNIGYGITTRTAKSLHNDGSFDNYNSLKIRLIFFLSTKMLIPNVEDIESIHVVPINKVKFPSLINSYINVYVLK